MVVQGAVISTMVTVVVEGTVIWAIVTVVVQGAVIWAMVTVVVMGTYMDRGDSGSCYMGHGDRGG